MTRKEFISQFDGLLLADRYDEARQFLEDQRPQLSEPEFFSHLGFLHHRAGDLDSAVAQFEKSIALAPEEPSTHYLLAMALLHRGDFARGWAEFEWRRHPSSALWRYFPQLQWNGCQEVRGRTVLLHGDGGYGDVIQYCRYAPMVAALGANVVLECQSALLPLAARLQGVGTAIAFGQALPPFHMHCPLQSLPLAFGTTLQTIPANVPYLTAPPEMVSHWRQKLGPRRGIRVGLTWCGGYVKWPRRSQTLAIFSPLAAIEGIEFHALQAGPAASEPRPPGMNVIDHASELTDFGQTAALASHMDLLISVETSVSHLCGALGKEVWVLLSKDACFRYLTDRSDSPWYPTMRLFRQHRGESGWEGVIDRIAAALRERMESSPVR